MNTTHPSSSDWPRAFVAAALLAALSACRPSDNTGSGTQGQGFNTEPIRTDAAEPKPSAPAQK